MPAAPDRIAALEGGAPWLCGFRGARARRAPTGWPSGRCAATGAGRAPCPGPELRRRTDAARSRNHEDSGTPEWGAAAKPLTRLDPRTVPETADRGDLAAHRDRASRWRPTSPGCARAPQQDGLAGHAPRSSPGPAPALAGFR